MSGQAGATFIATALKADAPLTAIVAGRVYEEMPPPGNSALPYVIFSLYAPGDVMGIGATRLWTNSLWTVKGVARTLSYKGDLGAIAGRIDAVLHGAAGSTVDGIAWALWREREIRYPEQSDAGDQVRHLGGIYRVMAT